MSDESSEALRGRAAKAKEVVLECPNCGSTELASSEDLSGAAHGSAIVDIDGVRQFVHEGWTEVWWDSSTTTGYECRDCDWTGKDLSELNERTEQ